MAAKHSLCLPFVCLLAVGDEPYITELDHDIQNNYDLVQ
jgi:hypothetical protein